MPRLRTDLDDAHLKEELADARDLVWAWDQLADAGAPVERMQAQARARVRDLEQDVPSTAGADAATGRRKGAHDA